MMPGFTRTWEWAEVVPKDSALALFINGTVTAGREHDSLDVRRGALYQRKVLAWRGRWRLAELRGWDERTGWDRAPEEKTRPVPGNAGE